MHKYVAIIQGPVEYLKEGVLVEEFKITQEEIDECREDDEDDAQVIDYILEEYHNTWEQGWCHAQVFTLGQYKIICPDFKSSI